MGNVYFFTGFPGFLAQSLLKNVAASDYPIEHIYLLSLPSLKNRSEHLATSLTSGSNKLNRSEVTVLEGDITLEDLGLNTETRRLLQTSVTHIFHLAAIYDLHTTLPAAEKINVLGTKNVTDWASQLVYLQRYTYFSTAYVSGKREGTIYEAELEMNQTFKNHYEKTKYDAEVYVRHYGNYLPVTVIRPGIVRGHSVTGETTKFDGPYFILRMFDRLQRSLWIPRLGYGKAEGNFVPVDFVIQAAAYLAHLPRSENKTYHLTDPAPSRMSEVYEMLMHEYLDRMPNGRIPLRIAEKSMAVPQIRRFFKVQREALSYFTFMSSYDCREASKDLAGSGIVCPPFDRTLHSMVDYYRRNKHDSSKHVHIQ